MLPPYVERSSGYDLALAGPYHQRGVTLRAFALRGDRDALQATCDRYLNVPGSGEYEYRPLGHTVLLTMLNMTRVSAGDASLGYMHEIDGAFQFPVLRYAKGDILPNGVATFMPYLWVNSDWPMVTGREVLGFRKEVGTSFSDGDDSRVTSAADLTHVDAWVIPSRGAALENRRVVDLKSAGASRGPAWEHPLALIRGVADALAGDLSHFALDAILHLFPSLMADSLTVPVAFLKQLRDARDGTRACYQQVFEANGKLPLSGFRGAWPLFGQHTVTIQDFVSHPILAELGLSQKAGAQTFTAEYAFEVDFDFDMELP